MLSPWQEGATLLIAETKNSGIQPSLDLLSVQRQTSEEISLETVKECYADWVGGPSPLEGSQLRILDKETIPEKWVDVSQGKTN